MRQLREDERDEIESVGHFIKYILSNKDARDYEVWHAMLKMEHLAYKYVIPEIISDSELEEFLDLDEMKEVVKKLMFFLEKGLNEKAQE